MQQEVPKPSVPYRSRRGVVFGVCRGFAEHFDLPVLWVRLGALAAFLFSSFWPVGTGYLVLALIMKPEPALPLEGAGEAEFYNSYASSRSMALARLHSSYQSLDRRIQRIESIVTDREFDWDRRFNNAERE